MTDVLDLFTAPEAPVVAIADPMQEHPWLMVELRIARRPLSIDELAAKVYQKPAMLRANLDRLIPTWVMQAGERFTLTAAGDARVRAWSREVLPKPERPQL